MAEKTNSGSASNTVPVADQPWAALWASATYVVVGTGIFLIVYLPAVLLNLLVHWLRH